MDRLVSAVPLYMQLRQEIRTEVLSGRASSEARLGTEAELMARFQVSRDTVRKALAGLVDEGLIRRVPGVGVVARKLQARTTLSPPTTGQVAIQSIDLHTVFSEATNDLIRSCASALEKFGFLASVFMVDPANPGAYTNAVFLRAVSERRIDGVVSMAFMGLDQYHRLRELRIPTVLTFEWDGMDLPSVCGDTWRQWHDLTCLVIEAGWRTPALVKGPAPYRTQDLQSMDTPLMGFRAVEGFRQGLARHRLPYYPDHVLRTSYRVEEAEDLAASIRRLVPKPDVLIVSGTEMAVALWDLLGHRTPVIAEGVRQVREDVCVVEVPMALLGARAAALLREYILGPASPTRQEFHSFDAKTARDRIFAYRKRFACR